jgi:hypothetical protein
MKMEKALGQTSMMMLIILKRWHILSVSRKTLYLF